MFNWLKPKTPSPATSVETAAPAPSHARPVAAKVQRPEWGQATATLPPWAKVAAVQHAKASITIDIDSDAAYAYWLELLGNPVLDQYWLEVAYQCIKLDLDTALAGTEHDVRFADRHVMRHFSRAEKYAQAGKPVGKSATRKNRDGSVVTLAGAELASRGLEARDHYVRIRGALPAPSVR